MTARETTPPILIMTSTKATPSEGLPERPRLLKHTCIYKVPMLLPPQAFRMRRARSLASSGNLLSSSRSGYEHNAKTLKRRTKKTFKQIFTRSLFKETGKRFKVMRTRLLRGESQLLRAVTKRTFVLFSEMLLTCLKKVMGCCPMAWASPMLALMTSSKGFFTPYHKRKENSLLHQQFRNHLFIIQPSWRLKCGD